MEEIIIYSVVLAFCLAVIAAYLLHQRKRSRIVDEKIRLAKQEGLYEPVSLHPVVDPDKCIQTGACIAACPEKDILGIRNGHATTINASRCVGHGACFHACPTEAITLNIGTEQRGVDLPHVDRFFESNVPGIYIAGELGGMGLIKNAVEQGRQAVENMARARKGNPEATYDVIVVGGGPAGISATLTAKKLKLKCLTIEQDSLGGTVFTFPRSKVVMTHPMDLPLYGKIRLRETSKPELLSLWEKILKEQEITIREHCKVDQVIPRNGFAEVVTGAGETFTSRFVLLAIGRRGSPRKLGIPGESMEKVAYRLLEPELISDQDILVVGGGDSAIESALLLAPRNRVTLSYRGDAFSRIKPKNQEKINEAIEANALTVNFLTTPVVITPTQVELRVGEKASELISNDLVFIFAGGELPTQFLQKAGITITKKFGEAVLYHGKKS